MLEQYSLLSVSGGPGRSQVVLRSLNKTQSKKSCSRLGQREPLNRTFMGKAAAAAAAPQSRPRSELKENRSIENLSLVLQRKPSERALHPVQSQSYLQTKALTPRKSAVRRSPTGKLQSGAKTVRPAEKGHGLCIELKQYASRCSVRTAGESGSARKAGGKPSPLSSVQRLHFTPSKNGLERDKINSASTESLQRPNTSVPWKGHELDR